MQLITHSRVFYARPLALTYTVVKVRPFFDRRSSSPYSLLIFYLFFKLIIIFLHTCTYSKVIIKVFSWRFFYLHWQILHQESICIGAEMNPGNYGHGVDLFTCLFVTSKLLVRLKRRYL